MAEIVLTTLNAKFIHAAFGLRYLMANLGELRSRACLREFDINQRPLEVVEALLACQPRVIGLGVYIWNVALATEVVTLLKRVRPEVVVILGGPEVSYETESQPIVQAADYVITGEGDLAFAAVCRQLLGGESPAAKILPAELPALEALALPYEYYDDADLARRVVYVEASRGCPFRCEFCLSSLDIPVRQFALPRLLSAFQRLLDRGLRQFKFVDRTFNLDLKTGLAILEFFRERHRPGLFLHFEMIPDRLSDELRQCIAQFPPGSLQFELGIQTVNDYVADRIHRRQNYPRVADNLRFLREQTTVHLHADLIVGLPGETLDSFGAGFDWLVRQRPHEIQVGMLKRLRGTPIVRHDAEWQMVYSPFPPYEILRNRTIPFEPMQRLRRFARFWDLLANSGNFVQTTPLLWLGQASPFASFLAWSDWAWRAAGRTHSLALARLSELLFQYLISAGQDPRSVAGILWSDYQRGGRDDRPLFLRPYLPAAALDRARTRIVRSQKRQQRHLGMPSLHSAGAVPAGSDLPAFALQPRTQTSGSPRAADSQIQ